MGLVSLSQFSGMYTYLDGLDHMYTAKIFYTVLVTIVGIETPPLSLLNSPVKQLTDRAYDAGDTISAFSDN